MTRPVSETNTAKGTVTVRGPRFDLEVEPLRDDLFRVEYLRKGRVRRERSDCVIFEKSGTPGFAVEPRPSGIRIVTRRLIADIRFDDLTVEYMDETGKVLLSPAVDPSIRGNAKKIGFAVSAEDRFYGMGQKSIPVDRKGFAFEAINRHIGGYTKPYPNLQVNIPYLYSPAGWGIFFDNPWPGLFDLAAADPKVWTWSVEDGPFRYHFTGQPNLTGLLRTYYDLTGYPTLLPKWTLGLLQSKCSYNNADEVYAILDEFRKRDLPLDAVILDAPWFGSYNTDSVFTSGKYTGMGNFSWNKLNFPDPDAYVRKLRDQGVKTVLINEPYVNTRSGNYALLEKRGWLVRSRGRKKPHVFSPHWCGDSSLFDATVPAARRWLWRKFKALVERGVEGLWIDLNEPEHPVPNAEYAAGPGRRWHNLFSLLIQTLIREGYEKDFPRQRMFSLARAGYAGIQRCSTMNWSGDSSKTWAALRLQVPMLIGCSMSGLPNWSNDIGGFTNAHDRTDGLTLFTNFDGKGVLTTPELYTRWFQFGVFSPALRPHSGEAQACEPFAFGGESEAVCCELLRWRYRLIPYIYSYNQRTRVTAEPFIKPLFWDHADPGASSDYDYMFGDELLVAPVLEQGKTERAVYLPSTGRGAWIDFWTDRIYEPGRTITVPAPLSAIPVFVRQPALIPLADVKRYVDELPDSRLTLRVYPGGHEVRRGESGRTHPDDDRAVRLDSSGGHEVRRGESGRTHPDDDRAAFHDSPGRDAAFDLYEDDGVSTDYLRGKSCLTRIRMTNTGNDIALTLEPSGTFRGMPKEREWTFDVRLIKSHGPIETVCRLDQAEHDPARNTLTFKVTAPSDERIALRIRDVVLAGHVGGTGHPPGTG